MMGTIVDKLNAILNTKNSFKQKFSEKGVTIDDSVPFSYYPDKMDEICGGTTRENMLKSGPEINYLLKYLANGDNINPDDYMLCVSSPIQDTAVRNILYTDSPPPNDVNTVTLDCNGEWIAWKHNYSTIYIYSNEDSIYMNYNSSCMFCYFSSLSNLDLYRFKTDKVTNMMYMFNNCTVLTSLDVSNFDTRNVRNMSFMFYYCKGLTSLDVSNFDTSNVTNMDRMFAACKGLTSLDVSNFDTRNVKNMYMMFQSCEEITSLDVSNFDTSNVSDMRNMFSVCTVLKTIYCNDDWYKAPLKSDYMFQNSKNLVGAISYDSSKITANYANPTTGYFTRK